jgi:hypothetical protein
VLYQVHMNILAYICIMIYYIAFDFDLESTEGWNKNPCVDSRDWIQDIGTETFLSSCDRKIKLSSCVSGIQPI